MKRVKLTRTIGTTDKLMLAMPGKECSEGEVVSVSEEVFDQLMTAGLGEAVDEEPKSGHRKAKTE